MIQQIIDAVMAEPSIAPFKASYDAFIASIDMYVPFILIGLCLIVGLFGRRLSALIRVIFLFAVGFIASVYWLVPFVTLYAPAIPGYVVGLAVGIIAACLSRFIYDAVYIGCIGFDIYNICFTGMFLVELTAMTKGNFTVSFIVAAIVVVIALLVRKYLEMILTSAVGGIGLAYAVKELYDFTLAFPGLDANTTTIIAGIIVTVIFFVIQYRNRIRY